MTSPGNANFTRVPVYNIHKENINALKDRMVEDIKVNFRINRLKIKLKPPFLFRTVTF